MVLYTIFRAEDVLEGFDDDDREFIEIHRGTMTLIVEPTGGGKGQLIRMISTDPMNYLDPNLQPGSSVHLE